MAAAPGEGYAISSALNSVARQVGAAIGVAVIVAVLTGITPATAPTAVLDTFEHAWEFAAGCMFVAAVGCLLVGRVSTGAIRRTWPAPRGWRSLSRPLEPEAARVPVARRAVTLSAEAPSRAGSTPAQFLSAAPLFAGLEPGMLETIASRLQRVHVEAGDYLFREGDAGNAMFVVHTGRLDVIDEPSGRVIRELGRGDALGELALISDTPRSASLRAARSSELFEIGRQHFEELLRGTPELALALNRVLAEQLRLSRATTTGSRPLPSTLAVVFVDDEPPDAALASELADACSAYLKCDVLGSGSAPRDALDEHAALIDRAEVANDLVVLDAGSLASGDGWTEVCLRQADRLLCVTRGGEPSDLVRGRVELRGCDLVICGEGYLPVWGEVLEPAESHVVRSAEHDGDVARIARRMTGNSMASCCPAGARVPSPTSVSWRNSKQRAS